MIKNKKIKQPWPTADQIGILGSSTGCHLAGSLGPNFDDDLYLIDDKKNKTNIKPDTVALAYPVITMI